VKKPTLRCNKKTIIQVEAFDLEIFVAAVYKTVGYSFVGTQECGNDSSHTFHIDGDLHSYEKDAEELRKGNAICLDNRTILNVLCD
jgi:hypothetical protein